MSNYDIDKLSKYICKNKKVVIKKGYDKNVVNSLSNKDITKTKVNRFVFATKFMFFIDKCSYPIYDGVVVDALKDIETKWGSKHNFSIRIDIDSINDYNDYKKVINDSNDCFKISPKNKRNYELIDKYLWLYGKNC